MMKCENFEFEYVVAPDEIAGDACEHLKTCSTCQSFVEQEKRFQEKLTSVINCDVPDGFRHSVRAHVVNTRSSLWSIPMASMAVAASLLVAVVFFTTSQNQINQSNFPVDQLVVEHVEHDVASFQHASHRLDGQQLAKVSKQFGVRVKSEDNVSFAERCPIGDSYGLHMVYQYQGHPITVIYMPEIPIKSELPFSYAGLKGWVKPMKKGSLAVVVGSTITLPTKKFIDQSIEWL